MRRLGGIIIGLCFIGCWLLRTAPLIMQLLVGIPLIVFMALVIDLLSLKGPD